ncbi:MAG: MBL fold metallo-hydrolase, partial [Candidatus Thermoplasmatota archaeon]
MRIRWHGHSCFEIENGIVVVTDPHDGESIGLKQPRINADIVLVSHRHYDHNSVKTVSTEQTKVIDTIGKSTANGIEFFGIESAHDEQNGKKRGRNIIYKFKIGSVNFCHLGDLGHEVDDEKLKEIGKVDILFIP